MPLSWFDSREEKAFAITLAKFYLDSVKKHLDRVDGKLAKNKQRILLNQLEQKIFAFKRPRRLNIYKKAQLVNAFKWHLLEAGLDDAYADELSSWVTHAL